MRHTDPIIKSLRITVSLQLNKSFPNKMKLFYYFLAENLVVSIPENGAERSDPAERFQHSLLEFGPSGPNFDFDYSGVPSKDEIKGIEISENMNPPPTGKPGAAAPSRGPCYRYCSSSTEYRSRDTNDRTGDHENF